MGLNQDIIFLPRSKLSLEFHLLGISSVLHFLPCFFFSGIVGLAPGWWPIVQKVPSSILVSGQNIFADKGSRVPR